MKKNHSATEELLSMEQVAEMLTMSLYKLRQITRKGLIVGYNFGYKSRWSYRLNDVHAFIAESRGRI